MNPLLRGSKLLGGCHTSRTLINNLNFLRPWKLKLLLSLYLLTRSRLHPSWRKKVVDTHFDPDHSKILLPILLCCRKVFIMSGDYSVVTQSMVNVKVSSNATSFLSERKIPKEMKIIELKVRQLARWVAHLSSKLWLGWFLNIQVEHSIYIQGYTEVNSRWHKWETSDKVKIMSFQARVSPQIPYLIDYV